MLHRIEMLGYSDGDKSVDWISAAGGKVLNLLTKVPELQVSRVRTTVSMPDEGTLLLGGLKFYVKDNRESGMPFFNNIPILSFLVTRKGDYVNRRNLLVLITARIVPLEELEPQDNLNVPDMPVRDWVPVAPEQEAAPANPCAPAPPKCAPCGR